MLSLCRDPQFCTVVPVHTSQAGREHLGCSPSAPIFGIFCFFLIYLSFDCFDSSTSQRLAH